MGGSVFYAGSFGPRDTYSGPEQPIGNFKRGERLQLRHRWSETLINGTTNPGNARFFEGPYLRIRPAANLGAPPPARRNESIVFPWSNAPVALPASAFNSPEGFHWDVDAFGGPIVFPFDASVAMQSDMGGQVILYDVHRSDSAIPDVDGAEGFAAYPRQEYTHTRVLNPGGGTRIVDVPPGANEFSLLGDLNAARFGLRLSYETASKAGSEIDVTPLPTSQAFGRIATAGARRVQLIDAGIATPVAIVFWVKF